MVCVMAMQVVAYDFGIKHNILRRLTSLGCQITVVPADYPAEKVTGTQPRWCLLQQWPGALLFAQDPQISSTSQLAVAYCQSGVGRHFTQLASATCKGMHNLLGWWCWLATGAHKQMKCRWPHDCVLGAYLCVGCWFVQGDPICCTLCCQRTPKKILARSRSLASLHGPSNPGPGLRRQNIQA